MDEEIQTIEEKIQEIKKIPKEELNRINKKVYENIFIAAIIMALCDMLILGYANIAPVRYSIDLKVFSVISLLLTIFVIELAYKKDSSKLAINAIELIFISVAFLSLPYLYMYNIYKFQAIVLFGALIFGVYYCIKGIIIIFREKSLYKKRKNDINEIIK